MRLVKGALRGSDQISYWVGDDDPRSDAEVLQESPYFFKDLIPKGPTGLVDWIGQESAAPEAHDTVRPTAVPPCYYCRRYLSTRVTGAGAPICDACSAASKVRK